MRNDNQNAESPEAMKPSHQTGEENGVIKGQQREGNRSPVTDTPRGSEPETRGTSGRRG
jgi:hypothetical protein